MKNYRAPLPTATELFLNDFSGMHYADVTSELIEKYAIKFAKMHVDAALKEASESRCINMYGKTWFSQSLEPGRIVLNTINITVDKDSILNSYPLNLVK